MVYFYLNLLRKKVPRGLSIFQDYFKANQIAGKVNYAKKGPRKILRGPKKNV